MWRRRHPPFSFNPHRARHTREPHGGGSRAARAFSPEMSANAAAVKARAVVVGGGFVGVACALHLQRAGFRHVTLMDAGPTVGGRHAASNGNAGTFAAYANIPVQRPGLWREAPGMILSPTGALRLAPDLRHLVRMVPWGLGALASCAPAEVRKTALALGTLLRRAEDGYRGAWEHAGVDVDGPMGAHAPTPDAADEPFAARRGYVLLQRDVRSAAAAAVAALRREGLGGDALAMEAIDQAGVLELEPNLRPEAATGGAWWFPDGWFLRDPAALLRAMADGFVDAGGEIRCGDGDGDGDGRGGSGDVAGCPQDGTRANAPGSGRVTGLTRASSGVRVTASDGSTTDAGAVVIAAGAHSAALARACGDPVPLDTERGYHVQWAPTPASAPPVLTRPVCTPEGGFIVTPMSGGVRAAGLVELGGTAAGPVPARFEQLETVARSLLRDEASVTLGDRQKANDWLGFRPTLPDALPVVGASSVPGVVYAFGHQHVGWTLGGITGEVVAQIATGKEPTVDLAPFSARRFARKTWWRPFA